MKCCKAGLALLLTALFAWGQPPTEKPTRLVIHPQREPEPALKYLLLPDAGDLHAGNAALYYHRAELLLKPGHQEKLSTWLEMPLEKLPRVEVREALDGYHAVLAELELGARRADMDWGLQFRTEGIALVLPEVQPMRVLIQVVALKARLEIAEGHFKEAIHTLQTGFAMSRHVGQSANTLVECLVGIAMTSVMAQRVEEFVQAPGAPDLYWALTQLPRPFIHLDKALGWERTMLAREFPGLWRVRRETVTVEEVQRLFEKVAADLLGLGVRRQKIDESRLGITALTIKFYPVAKRWLLSQGRSPKEIERMPTLQAVLIYSLDQYDRLRDNLFKWAAVPYGDARAGMDRAVQDLKRAKSTLSEGIPLASLLLPALERVMFAPLRADRQIAALRIVEALRLYAADHSGQLPEKLGDISAVPIPLDPVTGKAFEYQRHGATALLIGPAPKMQTGTQPATLRYEIRLIP